jgi:hypothetical protein
MLSADGRPARSKSAFGRPSPISPPYCAGSGRPGGQIIPSIHSGGYSTTASGWCTHRTAGAQDWRPHPTRRRVAVARCSGGILARSPVGVGRQPFPRRAHRDANPGAAFPRVPPPEHSECGRPDAGNGSTVRKCDPAFRERVLKAYEYRCTVYGFDVRLARYRSLSTPPIALGTSPAASRRRITGSPPCVLHQLTFDLGVLTLREVFFSSRTRRTARRASRNL